MTLAKDIDQQIPPLLTPPLLEVVFEARWRLQSFEGGRHRDPSYPMMYGSLYERLKKDFPYMEDLPATQMHPEASPYAVRHRMRAKQGGHPLVQIGPGIVSINQAKEYSWDSFVNLILKVVASIEDLYPKGTDPLDFLKAELRYLNAFPIDLKKEDPALFLKEKLHANVEVPLDLHTNAGIQGAPKGMNFTTAYEIAEPKGAHLILSLALGQMEQESSYLMQTAVDAVGENAPEDHEKLEVWLDRAHRVLKNTFLSFTRGELLKKFSGIR